MDTPRPPVQIAASPPDKEPQNPAPRGVFRIQHLPWSQVFAEQRTIGESLTRASWFSLSAVICCGLLYFANSLKHSPSPQVGWAVVSSILVLIPDAKQSVAMALARVSANVVGAIIGLIVAQMVGAGSAAIILAVVLVSYACHLFRLDMGLRTACVGVIIVMTAMPGDVPLSSLNRFVAVIVGCSVGVLVQLLILVLQRSVRRIPVLTKSNPAHPGESGD